MKPLLHNTQAPDYLRGTTRANLATLRFAAAKRGPTWRDERKCGMHNWHTYTGRALAPGRDGKDRVWYTHADPGPFRDEQTASEVLRLRHSGWYTDTTQDETCEGIVSRLSHGRFIAGYIWHANGERVYYPELFADERDAAHAADGFASSFAERSREDSERFEAMSLAEFDVEEKTKDVEKAFALRHRQKFGGVPRVLEAISDLRKARETLREATEAYERG
jgi:hypothetical protein